LLQKPHRRRVTVLRQIGANRLESLNLNRGLQFSRHPHRLSHTVARILDIPGLGVYLRDIDHESQLTLPLRWRQGSQRLVKRLLCFIVITKSEGTNTSEAGTTRFVEAAPLPFVP